MMALDLIDFRAEFDQKTREQTTKLLSFLSEKFNLSTKPELALEITEKMLDSFDELGNFVQKYISLSSKKTLTNTLEIVDSESEFTSEIQVRFKLKSQFSVQKKLYLFILGG